MKITKKTEVVVEEIELIPGEYYFECEDGILHRIVLTDYDDGEGLDYFFETVENFSDVWTIKVKKDTVFEEDELPYKFKYFITENAGKKIEKEKFYKVKQEVLQKLNT